MSLDDLTESITGKQKPEATTDSTLPSEVNKLEEDVKLYHDDEVDEV